MMPPSPRVLLPPAPPRRRHRRRRRCQHHHHAAAAAATNAVYLVITVFVHFSPWQTLALTLSPASPHLSPRWPSPSTSSRLRQVSEILSYLNERTVNRMLTDPACAKDMHNVAEKLRYM